MPDEISKLQERLEREVEARDKKFSQVYAKMSEDFKVLDGKIGEVLKAVSSRPSNDWKVVAVVIAFITLAFGLVENQIMTDARIANKGFEILQEAHEKSMDEVQSEMLRVRDWKDETEKIVPTLCTRIDGLKEIIDAKADDRFTGKQGAMIQKQVDRLEDRLTFLTKEVMTEQGGV